MKVYPDKKAAETPYGEELSVKDAITRKIAIAVAFASVFFFFIKLIFL